MNKYLVFEMHISEDSMMVQPTTLAFVKLEEGVLNNMQELYGQMEHLGLEKAEFPCWYYVVEEPKDEPKWFYDLLDQVVDKDGNCMPPILEFEDDMLYQNEENNEHRYSNGCLRLWSSGWVYLVVEFEYINDRLISDNSAELENLLQLKGELHEHPSD